MVERSSGPGERGDPLRFGAHDTLRRALMRDEFRLVYQPMMSLTTNRIIAVEALLRWERPNVGIVMPDEFIPAAELNGDIVPIGEWVLRESLRQLGIWHRKVPRTSMRVAVNLSARQFQSGLVNTVRDSLGEASIHPNNLCLEVTETTLMTDIESTVATLNELKGLGIRIVLDDFGTGYSSLEYLHRMPIDQVKIDRSFVAGLGVNTVTSAIVSAIVRLAQTTSLETVAEGVETREQLERLRSMGCDLAQGYLISRPIASHAIDDLLVAQAVGRNLPHLDGIATHHDHARWATSSVLIIDEESDVRLLARMGLTETGFRVEEASSGAAGLAMAHQSLPSCVVVDISTPTMDGAKVCREIRSAPDTKDCTVVVLTSHDDITAIDPCLGCADDYILKPFAPRDLAIRVRAAISRRRQLLQTMDPHVDRALLNVLQKVRDQQTEDSELAEDDHLSTRQIEILRRVLGGERVADVAHDLSLSQSTVRNHLSAIYHRFGVHSHAELRSMLRQRAATSTKSAAATSARARISA
ncbi:MAG: EAL domain-containing protein [Ilumatobacteraceae bacterium]